jgi:branched-subunit amino acid aminotransferase/4-amino-4-deoxychorismate lyase
MYISLNGRIITEEKAYIQINDRGFLLGGGLFETLKVQNGYFEFFDAHCNRLQASAKVLMLPFLYEKDNLRNNCLSIIKKK